MKINLGDFIVFDIGFLELCLIGVVALLVIGPEKLPRVARTVGLWMGKASGIIRTVKYDIDEQIRMEELKESLQKSTDAAKSEIKESVGDAEDAIQDIKQEMNEVHDSVEKETEVSK